MTSPLHLQQMRPLHPLHCRLVFAHGQSRYYFTSAHVFRTKNLFLHLSAQLGLQSMGCRALSVNDTTANKNSDILSHAIFHSTTKPNTNDHLSSSGQQRGTGNHHRDWTHPPLHPSFTGRHRSAPRLHLLHLLPSDRIHTDAAIDWCFARNGGTRKEKGCRPGFAVTQSQTLSRLRDIRACINKTSNSKPKPFQSRARCNPCPMQCHREPSFCLCRLELTRRAYRLV